MFMYAHVPRPDRASYYSGIILTNGASPTPRRRQALGRVCTYNAHACSGAGTRAVPYTAPHRGRAPRFANHGSVIGKTFHSRINVRFMDRSLNVYKTFYNRNKCLIYGISH